MRFPWQSAQQGAGGIRRAAQEGSLQAPYPIAAGNPLASYGPSGVPPMGVPYNPMGYRTTPEGAALSPHPKLSWGTLQTGGDSSGAAGNVPGYVVAQYIPPAGPDLNPPYEPRFRPFNIPRVPPENIRGQDALTPNHVAHRYDQADRFFNQGRSVPAWMQSEYPGYNRMLVQRQVVQRYNLYSAIAGARPLDANDYFVGYITAPSAGIAGGTSVP